MTNLRRVLEAGIASLALAACGGGGGSKVDEIAAAATASCEASTTALKAEGETMLPGRICGNCHKKGGQSANFLWTVSGTIYGSATSACNTGGLSGVKVEIFEGAATTAKLTLTTNAAGNFYSSQAVTFPIRARITQGAKTQEMFGQMATGNCASCHQNPGLSGAPGRIFLN